MVRSLPLLLLFLVAGCDSTGGATVVEGLASDVPVGLGDDVTLYSLQAVADDALGVFVEDAQSTAWDVGFRGAEVLLNGGASGPGAAIGVVVDGSFASITDALQDDVAYRRDGDSFCPSGPPRAVCTGPGDGLLALVDGEIRPTPSRVLLIRLADSQGYAKLQIDRVGEGAGGEPVLTFRYAVNPTGSSFGAK